MRIITFQIIVNALKNLYVSSKLPYFVILQCASVSPLADIYYSQYKNAIQAIITHHFILNLAIKAPQSPSPFVRHILGLIRKCY